MSSVPQSRIRISLSDLNPPQREAVTTTEGPLLVLAGAGSGKTRVITYRIAYLLSQGVPADAIVAVSFTNKAADEMRERVDRLVDSRLGRKVTLSTFHSLGLMILKEEREALGFPGGFTIYDTSDQLGVIREILRHAHIEDRRLDNKSILFRISKVKNAGLSPLAFAEQLRKQKAVSEYDGFAAEVYPRYQERMRAFNALDFDDLLVETLRLFKENQQVRERWSRRFRYLMIDEYQDTNRCQLELLRHLAEPNFNLAVVGDDDQSIYSWRGAEARNILEFAASFPGAKTVKLEENYRSTYPILQAANAVIAKNTTRHKKSLWTSKKDGERVQLVICPDGEGEAKWVAEEIDILRERRKVDLRDMAVLYRSNVQAKLIEEELRQARIDYRMIGGQAFFDRKEVKDSIAYLKILTHPMDEISLRRVLNYPARGIGTTTVEKLGEAHKQAQKRDPKATLFDLVSSLCLGQGDLLGALPPKTKKVLSGFIDTVQRHRAQLLHQPGWRDAARAYLSEMGVLDDLIRAGPTPLQSQRRLKNLDSFLESLNRFEEKSRKLGKGSTADLASYLHRLTLSTNDDDADELGGDKVTLSTLHGAKGLEFKVVFLVGVEEELLPHKRTLYPSETDLSEVAGPVDVSEERRLCYVGITRAREILYLSRARFRGSRNTEMPRAPSRLLDDIPKDLLQVRDLEGPGAEAADPADEDAFIRAQLEKMRKMTES